MPKGPEDPDRKLVRIERHYQRVYQHLEPSVLKTGKEDWPTDREIEAADSNLSGCRFLDYYTVEGLRVALESYGFLKELRKKGLGDPTLSLNRHPEGYDILRIRCKRSPHPLVELVAQVGPLPSTVNRLIPSSARKFLHVRWLRMQNPLAKVPPERPLLPGQDFPGLGLGREMMALLQLICSRMDLDGMLVLPERLHNAALYFQRFRFLDPEIQGVLTAILRDTRERTLSELAWGVELGGLVDRSTAKSYRWIAKEQALPRSGPVLLYLNSQEYRVRAKETMERSHFSLSTGDLALDMLRAQGKDPAGTGSPFPARIK